MSIDFPDTNGLSASLIFDAVEAMYPDEDIRNRIAESVKPIGSPSAIIGRAWTIKFTKAAATSPENRLRAMEVFDSVPAGVVLVMQVIGDSRALIGDVLAHRFKKIGVLGVVVDGAVRDVEGMSKYGPSVWASSVNMEAVKGASLSVETQVPIDVGGVRVFPGDLVAADMDGVMINPVSDLVTLIEKTSVIQKAERLAHKKIDAGCGLAEAFQPNE